jgi:hypothetical protein
MLHRLSCYQPPKEHEKSNCGPTLTARKSWQGWYARTESRLLLQQAMRFPVYMYCEAMADCLSWARFIKLGAAPGSLCEFSPVQRCNEGV